MRAKTVVSCRFCELHQRDATGAGCDEGIVRYSHGLW